MYVYQFRSAGEVFQLVRSERDISPGPGQVKVRVRACSLNYRDIVGWKNLAGRKLDGRIPLSDGAGEIIECGEGVTTWKVGDHVAGCFFQTWQTGRFDMAHHKADLGGAVDGMLGQEVLLSSDGVVRLPDSMSFEAAACLPCAALTAWYSLFTRGGVNSQDTVLTLGTGGVSIFALQFAKAIGAKVIITSGSDDKLQKALAMGAKHGVNYRTYPDWDKEVWRLTDKRGADHIIEVGGPGTLGKSMGCVAAGGRISLIGVLSGFGPPTDSLFPLMSRNASLEGIYVGPRADFVRMMEFMTEHHIDPIIDRTFAFDEAEEAFRYMESGSHFGKIVIRID